MEDFTRAVERIVAGIEKRSRILSPKERKVVAYHEMGHALVASALPGVDAVHKVSIIPRGIGALGYTMQRPTEDRFLIERSELVNRMAVLMGGRAAEEIIFGEISTGAADDLDRATDIARQMVTRFGMSDGLGQRVYEPQRQAYLGEAMRPRHRHRAPDGDAVWHVGRPRPARLRASAPGLSRRGHDRDAPEGLFRRDKPGDRRGRPQACRGRL
jgi:cell division protease FtsH